MQVTDTGQLVAYFSEVAVPVRTGPYVVARCVSCGQTTVAGLYTEVNTQVPAQPA